MSLASSRTSPPSPPTNGLSFQFSVLTSSTRLVDEITYKKAAKAADVATQSAILGPFFRHDHPTLPKGANISHDTPADAEPVYMYGKVMCAKTNKPLAGAMMGSGLRMTLLLDYAPCYRSEAGTGSGMGFAYWR